jgi:tetratricopeptide (TPR) repeat protein
LLKSTVIYPLVTALALALTAACGGPRTSEPSPLDGPDGPAAETTWVSPAQAIGGPTVEAADGALVEGRFRDARPAYLALVETAGPNESLSRAVLLHASTLLAAGLHDEAAASVITALSEDTLDADERAFAYGLLGRCARCSELLALPLLASDAGARSDVALVAGICALQTGHTTRAAELLANAGDGAQAQVARGILEWIAGDLAAARRAFDDALAQEPDSLDALRNSGMLLWQSGDHDEARSRLQRYLDLSPPALSDRSRIESILREH